MTALKALGALLLLGLGILSARRTVHLSYQRLSRLDAWLELILLIRAQIDCYLTPLDEILKKTDPCLLSACGKQKADSLPALFAEAAPLLGREEHRLLECFVREIGSGYREEQLKRCDYYLDALRTRRSKLAEAQPGGIKLGVTLSLCASLFAVILLW